MKIYLPVLIASSALFLSTSAHSMEISPLKEINSSNKSAVSLSRSTLKSATADIFSFERRESDYVIDLSTNNNSLTLKQSEISRMKTTASSNNTGQFGYSATTTILKF